MIKLKLNRDQLYVLCIFTNPATYEDKVCKCISIGNFDDLALYFNLIAIGEKVSKQYLFTNKNKNSIRINYAQAASLLNQTYNLEFFYEEASYEWCVIQTIRAELHQQLANFQRKYYGQQKLLDGELLEISRQSFVKTEVIKITNSLNH